MSRTSTRPLPHRPDLEFERKQAKKLLRQLPAGDPEALKRAHAQIGGLEHTEPADLKLAHAQLAIAREYGFASWPRLVEYFTTLARHERSGLSDDTYSPKHWEERAEGVIKGHRIRHAYTGRLLAAFVPRFDGLTLDEVFASDVTMDDARLVVAREARRPGWEALGARARPELNAWTEYASPRMRASRAVEEEDLPTLKDVVTAHPELLTDRWGLSRGAPLAYDALLHEAET